MVSGSYAHKDIAFEFGMWISAEFKNIPYQRVSRKLKDIELGQLGWGYQKKSHKK
ncbi:MAG: KilA-N domain-containing protein [Sulfurimonas sp.]|nr:KilA-N domain-containing protein [Sulfurimonas sp.]